MGPCCPAFAKIDDFGVKVLDGGVAPPPPAPPIIPRDLPLLDDPTKTTVPRQNKRPSHLTTQQPTRPYERSGWKFYSIAPVIDDFVDRA